jgi:WD40 repeat protein
MRWCTRWLSQATERCTRGPTRARFGCGIHLITNSRINPRILCGHTKRVSALCISRSTGTLYSGSSDSTIRAWSDDGTCIRTLIGQVSKVRSLAVGRLKVYSGSADSFVRVWSEEDGTLLYTVPHGDEVFAVALGPNDTVYSGSWDSYVRMWSDVDGKNSEPKKVKLGGPVDAIAVCAAGTVYTAFSGDDDDDNTVHAIYEWDGDLEEARSIDSFQEGHTEPISVLACGPNGNLYSSAEDDTICVWLPMDGGHRVHVLPQEARALALALRPDGTLYSGGGAALGGNVRIW